MRWRNPWCLRILQSRRQSDGEFTTERVSQFESRADKMPALIVVAARDLVDCCRCSSITGFRFLVVRPAVATVVGR